MVILNTRELGRGRRLYTHRCRMVRGVAKIRRSSVAGAPHIVAADGSAASPGATTLTSEGAGRLPWWNFHFDIVQRLEATGWHEKMQPDFCRS